MATQYFALSLFLVASLITLASPAAINPVTSQEEAYVSRESDEAQSKALNLVQPQLESRIFKIVDEASEEENKTPLTSDEDDVSAAAKGYVDASMFRKVATDTVPEVMKAKGSFFTKKATSNVNKHAKEEIEMKKQLGTASDKLEPPVEDSDATADNVVVDILSAIRDIIDTEGRNDGDDETKAVVAIGDASVSTTTSASTKEDDQLPRLSPPIWSHSTRAEAMSDSLRLPMIEPYDREDRYSHSIAQGAFW